MKAADVIAALEAHASPQDAVFLQRFFKTGPGQYGEGDVFIGVRVPMTRQVCKQFKDLSLGEVQKLLDSTVHEHRLAGLILLADTYGKATADRQQAIYDLYLKNLYAGRINNWDLVDASAEFVVGPHLRDKPRQILLELARSESIWQRRVAIIATFYFIKQGDASVTLQIAEELLHDQHDLIQKAVGWMLREAGKRIDEKILTDFLHEHYREMPRTMLRYAIERLSVEQKSLFYA